MSRTWMWLMSHTINSNSVQTCFTGPQLSPSSAFNTKIMPSACLRSAVATMSDCVGVCCSIFRCGPMCFSTCTFFHACMYSNIDAIHLFAQCCGHNVGMCVQCLAVCCSVLRSISGYIYINVYVYVQVYVYIWIYIYIYIYKERERKRKKGKYVYMDIYMCIYINIYIYR